MLRDALIILLTMAGLSIAGGLAIGLVSGILAGGIILVVQGFIYLKKGVWKEVDLYTLLDFNTSQALNNPENWIGLANIIKDILQLHPTWSLSIVISILSTVWIFFGSLAGLLEGPK